MSSTSERGHAKNVATFERLVQTCQGFGTRYNPSNQGITVTALQAISTTAQQAMTALNTAKPAYSMATSEREDAYKGLDELTRNVIATLAANSFPDSIIADAKNIQRRINGSGSTPSHIQQNNDTPTPRTRSTSQRSYDNRVSYFEQLVLMVTGLTGYAPNETHLSATGLAAHVTTLRTLNSTVTSTFISLTQARISRDSTLYDPRTGAVTLAKQVKNYVKAVYGKDSTEYLSIARLEFTR
ncbi:MAG: hypothetical protein EBS07_02065 [Sphingobacteriia bacterium]|nr:hypothetical protein [Sphingobacteriia bacterium]